ncbi:GNAT family N-acetyltransferase [Halalkalibacillus halophilus]|uniref:GNAT family N-acetyltransferase n=1 Tax=Halalkalibacillus halophilus TaxID=392827 RepID=UPI000404CD2C|nr:GNAT family protein [Halalkalibacillus halophilus]
MIRLEYFTNKDYDRLINWVESARFMMKWGGPGFTFPLTKEQLDEYTEETNEVGSSRYVYNVVYTKTEEVIGHVSLGKIDYFHGIARVGKVLVSPNARGKGFTKYVMEEALTVAFDELNLHRVSLGVFDNNQPAVKAYESFGFVKEGLLRDARRFGEEYWDLWEMSLLEDEWRTIQNRRNNNESI